MSQLISFNPANPIAFASAPTSTTSDPPNTEATLDETMGFKGIASVFFNKHSSSPSPAVRGYPHASLAEETIRAIEPVIARWGSERSDSDYIFTPGHREEAMLYVESVRGLQDSMHRLVKEDPCSEVLVLAQSLMEASMKRLTKEFHRLLSTNLRFGVEAGESVSGVSSGVSTPARLRFWDHSQDESEFDRSEFDGRDERGFDDHCRQGSLSSLSDSRMIADCMIALGYAKECMSTYKIVRRSIVEEELYNYGWETLVISSQQIQKMDWDVLEAIIKRWLAAVKVALKKVFPQEKFLCNAVFSASESLSQSCFADITRDIATGLFEFAGAAGKGKKSPEKIFRMLDMYEAIAKPWLEIEATFSSDSTSVIRSKAVDCLIKLGETVRLMLRDFEMAIQKDSSKSAVPGGGVHPLTRYVMNYLVFLGDYGETLEDIVADWPLELHGSLPEPLSCLIGEEFGNGSSPSAISTRFAWLILVLLCKLDAKAELFKDVALSYLFLANNLRYVVAKVMKSSLRHVLCDNWIIKHDSKVREYAGKYERIGWAKVLSSLPEEKMTVTAEIGHDEVRGFIVGFNAAFEEAFARQASWVAPDPKLREEIRGSLAGKLLPAYRRVYAAFGKEKPRETSIRFVPEDLENYLSELLYVTGGSRDDTLSYSDSTTGTSRSSRSSGSSTGSFPAHFLFGLGR
ncbi:hypothetical protein MLD38_003994 [Melastoma candidum]|uniref:Uncharacterized protein n=1 Tax=Melastoma candidum TaxID=119954 RepID=A0ACB9S697_9MYRT|nr:hypothetical protein MLD38_003994 [Melastoma candidum]